MWVGGQAQLGRVCGRGREQGSVHGSLHGGAVVNPEDADGDGTPFGASGDALKSLYGVRRGGRNRSSNPSAGKRAGVGKFLGARFLGL